MTFRAPTIRDVIVVDSFYSSPETVRDTALRLRYYRAPGNVAAAQSRTPAFSRNVVNRFSELVACDVYFNHAEANFGHFRVELSSDQPRLLVHADREDWAALIHLSLPACIRGGTALLRHRATRLTGPPTDEEASSLGYANAADFDDRVLLRDTLDVHAWDMIGFVPARFNRLLLLRGSIFYHAPWGQFGDSFQTGRLTQHFFFNELR